MSTNRKFRTRNRRPSATTAIEDFFIYGHTEDGDVMFDLFANEAKIYAAWTELCDSLKKSRRRILAATVFDGNGTRDRFPQFPWISRQAYREWQAEQR